jgi:small subunit ribosomal protein S5
MAKNIQSRSRTGRDHSKTQKICRRIFSVRWVYSLNAGGRKQRTSVFAIAGNSKGRVGIGLGKAKNTTIAAQKAVNRASKIMRRVFAIAPGEDPSIHHDIKAKYGATKVIIRPSVKGSGIRGSSSSRLLMECAGIKNIVVKVHGSNNPLNVIRAISSGLDNISSPQEIMTRRNVGKDRLISYQRSNRTKNASLNNITKNTGLNS